MGVPMALDYRTSVVCWLLRHFDTQHADIPSWYAGLDAQDQTRAVIDSLFKLNEDNVAIPKFKDGETFRCIIDLKKKSQVKRAPTPTDPRLKGVPTPTDPVLQGVPTPTDLCLQGVPTPTDPVLQGVPTPTDPRLQGVPTPTHPRLKRVPTLTDSRPMTITGDQVMDVVDNINEVHEIVDSSPGDQVAGLAEHRPQRRLEADGGFLIKFQKFDRTSDLYPFAIRVRSCKLELLSLIRNEVYMDKLARELTACMIENLSLNYVFRKGLVTQPLLDHFVWTMKNSLPLLLVDMNYETDDAMWSLYIGAFRFILTYVEGNEPVIKTESRTAFNYSHA